MSRATCFVNGKIYVKFKPVMVKEAIVTAHGRVLYVGEANKALSICKALNGKVVDLGGNVIMPGFIDSHMHLDGLGARLSALELRGVKSIREMVAMVKQYMEKRSPRIAYGGGWDQELFEERRWPTRWDLDEVVNDRPVILFRVCGHAAVLNTKAMELAGFLEKPSPWVLKDERGTPTGMVVEAAAEEAWRVFTNSLSTEERVEMMRLALEHAALHGVTAVGFMSCSKGWLGALSMLLNDWKYPRVRAYVEPSLLKDVIKLGLRRGFGDENLRIQGVKLFADGSLGARTAWLSKPYSDEPSKSGNQLITKEELLGIVGEASGAGFQAAVHGIGDAAIDLILAVYREIGDVRRYRHRIEHASVIRPDQIEEVAKLGVAVSIQPRFVVTDWWAGRRLGPDRLGWLYPFKSMIAKGVALGLSTDSPVEPLDPWETVFAAASRKEQALSVEEALHYYTYGSAYALNEEWRLGALEESMLADFIIIDRDPLKTRLEDLRGIRVLETYIGGVKAAP